MQGGLPAISLPSITALNSAFCNDVDPELIYAQSLIGLAKKNDILIGISTSGNSKNVFGAVKVAKALGITVIGLTGKTGGVLVASRGLYEYEVLRDGKNTMALTLLRAVGEIGDWGVFPTPDMQLKREMSLEYSFIPYSLNKKASAFNEAYTFAGDFFCTCQSNKHTGKIIDSNPIITAQGGYIVFSTLKRSENGDGIVMRVYNVSDSEQTAEIRFIPDMFSEICETNLAENKLEILKTQEDKVSLCVPAKKIKTILLKYKRDRI